MSKPDDRSDNAAKIKQTIQNTAHNVEVAEEIIAHMPDGKNKQALQEKNDRRQKSIPSLAQEFKDEGGNKLK